MRKDLIVFVFLLLLAHPLLGIFTETCQHQQILQASDFFKDSPSDNQLKPSLFDLTSKKVLADVKECLATAEQMQGVCRMVERRERCK